MSNFIKGEWQVADEKTCKALWSGGKNGKYFRCAFCGHRFKPGDKWRCQYTNDTNGAGGNPLVCEDCNLPKEELIEVWKAKHKLWHDMHSFKGEWWWFARLCEEY